MIGYDVFFFFNDTATTEIYTLSLHDALPIYEGDVSVEDLIAEEEVVVTITRTGYAKRTKSRSEEHTSELQSRQYLVCRLLLEKKTTVSNDYHYWLRTCQ